MSEYMLHWFDIYPCSCNTQSVRIVVLHIFRLLSKPDLFTIRQDKKYVLNKIRLLVEEKIIIEKEFCHIDIKQVSPDHHRYWVYTENHDSGFNNLMQHMVKQYVSTVFHSNTC